MKLKKGTGRIEIKALGIVLTQDSSADDCKRAVEHMPSLKNYMESTNTKPAKDDKEKK